MEVNDPLITDLFDERNRLHTLLVDPTAMLVQIDGVPFQQDMTNPEVYILNRLAQRSDWLLREGDVRPGMAIEGSTLRLRRRNYASLIGRLATHEELSGYIFTHSTSDGVYAGLSTHRYSREPFIASVSLQVASPIAAKNFTRIIENAEWTESPAHMTQQLGDVRQAQAALDLQQLSTTELRAAKRAHVRNITILGMESFAFLEGISAFCTIAADVILSHPRRRFKAPELIAIVKAEAGLQNRTDQELIGELATFLGELKKQKNIQIPKGARNSYLKLLSERIDYRILIRYNKDPLRYLDAVRLPGSPEDLEIWRTVTTHAPIVVAE